ncbi:MAG: hypothetical protein LBC43_04790 [Bifidobacteriaceae bacterium]|jgi:hypothetical protein|nr:hypothetical protein [Bifidobacteriaceae bacterium]
MTEPNLAQVWIPQPSQPNPESWTTQTPIKSEKSASLAWRILGSIGLAILVATIAVFNYRQFLSWYVPVGLIGVLLLIFLAALVARWEVGRVGVILYTLVLVLTMQFFVFYNPESWLLVSISTESSSWIYANAAELLLFVAPGLALIPLLFPAARKR